MSKKILMVAGEVSGDLHGAHLLEAIHRIDPEIQCFGMGGERLERAGMRLLYPSKALSVVGITEVLPKLGSILKALRVLRRSLIDEKPDLVILIDFPDFNLRLARSAHRMGIPVLYYISPQVWAWRSGRIKKIAQWVDQMIVFFPFEVPLYERAGLEVHWVGHPLIDIAKSTLPREEALARFGLDPHRRIVGLLPGSRAGEIERLLPIQVEAARFLERQIPGLQFLIPLAPGIPPSLVSRHLTGITESVRVIEGLPYEVMKISDLLITASGTATLEAAALGTPMIIIYRVSTLSYWIGRALIRVKHIGLVNLVSGKRIVPELIQQQANPERISEEALRILKDPRLAERMKEEMKEVRRRLGQPGAAERAARIVYSFVISKMSKVG